MEKERETLKNKQKMPFLGGKTLVFLLKTKKGKEPTKKQRKKNTTKTKKENK